MAAHAESNATAFDTVKIVLAIMIVIAGIVGFYVFSAQPLLYRVLGVLLVGSGAVALLFTTALGRTIWGFFVESRIEVRKMIWPTRQEAMQATMVVVACVFLVGLFLWLLDMFLFWVIGLLTGQKV